MKTIKLYMQNVYLSTIQSTVTSVQGHHVALDQTIFFPKGGGQSCDLGSFTISGSRPLDVLDVYEEDGVVWHHVPNHTFEVGDNLTSKIDWSRRFDNMQRHCGEHIMSGVWFREYKCLNKGFHMGENYMTIDISTESSDVHEITWDMAMQVETLINDIICQDLPITTKFFIDKDEANRYPLRKAITADGNISVVFIGDVNDPVDCVACCGTHPISTGQVGLIKIYKIEKNKGMFRIYFDAGKRALKDYRLKHDIITHLGNKYSASTDDLIEKMALQEKRHSDLKIYHNKIRETLLNIRMEEISDCLSKEDGVLFFESDDMLLNDIMYIGKSIAKDVETLLVISELNTNTVMLFSNGNINCGNVVKNNISDANGRGGGNMIMARAVFENAPDLNKFLHLIQNTCQ